METSKLKSPRISPPPPPPRKMKIWKIRPNMGKPHVETTSVLPAGTISLFRLKLNHSIGRVDKLLRVASSTSVNFKKAYPSSLPATSVTAEMENNFSPIHFKKVWLPLPVTVISTSSIFFKNLPTYSCCITEMNSNGVLS